MSCATHSERMKKRTSVISAVGQTLKTILTANNFLILSMFPSFQGDTLIHSVAARGDSHGEILAELLSLKTVQGNPVFDLSRCNYDG